MSDFRDLERVERHISTTPDIGNMTRLLATMTSTEDAIVAGTHYFADEDFIRLAKATYARALNLVKQLGEDGLDEQMCRIAQYAQLTREACEAANGDIVYADGRYTYRAGYRGFGM